MIVEHKGKNTEVTDLLNYLLPETEISSNICSKINFFPSCCFLHKYILGLWTVDSFRRAEVVFKSSFFFFFLKKAKQIKTQQTDFFFT